ncbi:MAG: terminase small subunit [Gallionellaceae bacterium]|nr:terminase small subunit [Gallionellaceae bacterium]
MTPKRSAFIAEYLICHNASEAARRAGYSVKTAYSQGERLLRNVEVRSAIDKGMKKLATGLEITAERVQKERARLAFFDVSKLFDAEGRPLPINQIDADTRAAIVGIDVVDGELSTVRKYRLATKDASLAALVENHRRALETSSLETRLEAIEEQLRTRT